MRRGLLALKLEPALVVRSWGRLGTRLERAATPLALAIAIDVGLVAVQYGAFVAGGADSSGYPPVGVRLCDLTRIFGAAPESAGR